MASNDYRMNLIWTSHGEQLRADLERNIGRLTNFRGEVSQNNRQMGLWGQQIRAVGTTLRYAFAGAVVYGVATAINSLSDFEVKLGDIDSLAARVSDGRLVGLGNQLSTIGDFALETSNRMGVAVSSIEDYMARFYSSFDPPAGRAGIQQAKDFADAVTTLQLAVGGEVGDPAKLASGIAGFMQSIPGARRNIKGTTTRLADIIAEVTRLSPVITGEDITRDVGRLGSAQVFSRMTPEQIFAVYGAASRAGGSGAVIGRGITQLLGASLMHPTNKRAMAAFGAVGLPTDPNALRAIGGWDILMRMLKGVQTGPVRLNAAALRNPDLTDEEALSQAGTRGINMRIAANLFPRQESLRQFLNLLALGGPSALTSFISSIQDAEKQHRAAQRAELARNQRTLQIAGNAQKNLNLQVLRGFDPVLHALSRTFTGLSNLGIRHPDATTAAITGTAGAALASRIFLGVGLGGLIGRGFRRLPGVGGALGRLAARNPLFGRMLGRGGDLAAAGLVGSGLGAFSSTGRGTRSDPIWVVIDPLSWFMPGAPSRGGPGGGGGPPIVPAPVPGASRWRRWGGRLLRLGRRGAGLGAAAAAGGVASVGALEAAAIPLLLGGDTEQDGGLPGALGHVNQHAYPTLFRVLQSTMRMGRFSGAGLPPGVIRDALSGMGTPGTHGWHPGRANAMLERAMRQQRLDQGAGRGGALVGMVEGTALVELLFRATPEVSRLLRDMDKRVHVPVKLWPAASGGGRPKTRGKAKTTRGQSGR